MLKEVKISFEDEKQLAIFFLHHSNKRLSNVVLKKCYVLLCEHYFALSSATQLETTSRCRQHVENFLFQLATASIITNSEYFGNTLQYDPWLG